MGTIYTEPPVNPPRAALFATGVAAVSGGIVASGATHVSLMTAFWTVAFLGTTEGSPAIRQGNIPLAAGLLLVAVVFAGLALLITALIGGFYAEDAKAEIKVEPVETSMLPLKAYATLNFLGLSAFALGLTFLARDVSGCRRAAIVGTVLQILALAVGAFCRLEREKKEKILLKLGL